MKYYVWWHTKVGIGATYYSGTETVNAEDEDSSQERAQRNVWRRMFRDWPMSHIVVTDVTTSKPPQNESED